MKKRLVWKDDICPICGRPRSKHSFDDECLQIGMMIAKSELLNTLPGRSSWYNVEVTCAMDHLSKYWETHKDKVHSSFKKSFVPSVLEFYKKNGFLSKKQLKISEDIIFSRGSNYQTVDEFEASIDFDEEVAEKRSDLLEEYSKKIEYNELQWDDSRQKVRYYKTRGWLY